ncbi:MAG: FAD-dependent oxidoreductase [Prolixibacteraceae bacterium]|jgi:heterodisulfide reductase subunit A
MKHVLVIGGGIAGIETASQLTDAGHWVTLIEKETKIGGKLNDWSCLFPDFTPAGKITEPILRKAFEKDFTIRTNTEVKSIQKHQDSFAIEISGNQKIEADAVVIATGYELFDARRKEEYGYKIYDSVITSADLEKMLNNDGDFSSVLETNPKRIAFVHCVGSRDEKSGNHYCSKICCITGVKQAIELKRLWTETEIFCFYMDLRLYGKHFEELYREAQEKYDIQFIRGRVSEASEKIDKSLLIKAEDTLSGRPLKMNVDLLVLLIGMESGKGTANAATTCKIDCENSGFLRSTDSFLQSNLSTREGIFLAGSCTAPMSVNDTILHARSAAFEVNSFLQKNRL